MKPIPTPRRLLQLDALFSRRERWGGPGGLRGALEPQFEDTRMPEDAAEMLSLQSQVRSQLGRIAVEVALEEGGRREYPLRQESVVLEARRER